MSELTGKRRYRVSGMFRHKLVLQVEVYGMTHVGGWVERCIQWRDATVEDLLTISASHTPFPVVEEC